MRSFTIAALALLPANFVCAEWTEYTSKVDTQVASGCSVTESCLQPIYHDSDVEHLCDKIIDNPCKNQDIALTTGLLFWATSGDCSVEGAKPSKDTCMDYFMGTRMKINDQDCAVGTEVKDTGGKYQGDVAMKGNCIPIDPLGGP